jgi:hypothetical protein
MLNLTKLQLQIVTQTAIDYDLEIDIVADIYLSVPIDEFYETLESLLENNKNKE